MRLRAIREEYQTMLAAEKNGRRIGLDRCFFETPMWSDRKAFLQSVLQPVKLGQGA